MIIPIDSTWKIINFINGKEVRKSTKRQSDIPHGNKEYNPKWSHTFKGGKRRKHVKKSRRMTKKVSRRR